MLSPRASEENGFFGACVVQKSTGFILAGNHRFEAAKKNGAETVPAIWVDVDDATALRILLADNRTSDVATYDFEVLARILLEVQQAQGSAKGTGYDEAAVRRVMAQANVVVAARDAGPTEPQAQAVCQTGDIWVLGRHRLMIGDALVDAGTLMAGEQADLVFTDPPYNVDYEGYTEDRLKIEGDRMTAEQYCDFLASAFVAYRAIIKPTASLYVCHPAFWQRQFQDALDGAGFEMRCQIIWAKNTFAWGFGRYKFQHEPIFYAHVAGESDAWYGDKSQTTLWQVNKPSANREHPTAKPIELVERAIVNSSRQGDVVVDLFGGSGSTLIAAEGLGRQARLMEIDPAYGDVIIRRWAGSEGKATLGGQAFEEVARRRDKPV